MIKVARKKYINLEDIVYAEFNGSIIRIMLRNGAPIVVNERDFDIKESYDKFCEDFRKELEK